jgi:hypothetical protein
MATALVSDGHRQRPVGAGAGFGQAMMHSHLDRCDGEHAPAYLEASEQALIPYYNRSGSSRSARSGYPTARR